MSNEPDPGHYDDGEAGDEGEDDDAPKTDEDD